jgi:GMP synthase (glutamine-hydrolysing)
MHIHIIQHEPFEAPGAITHWIETRNHTVSYTHVFDYQPLPASVEGVDLLVVMGGPQSPDTSLEECPYYNAEAEMAFIRQNVEAGKRVFGVCLGAQLIGQALGASYEHSPEKEIGVFSITLTEAGLNDPYLKQLMRGMPVGHWHNDMPGLTAESLVLATSAGCPRQIIRYTESVYGFQCHLELTPTLVEGLIAHDEAHWPESGIYPFVQTPEVIRAYDYTAMNEALWAFLDGLVGGT